MFKVQLCWTFMEFCRHWTELTPFSPILTPIYSLYTACVMTKRHV